MGKIIGIFFILGGIADGLYQWVMLQRERQKRLDELEAFLHKSIFLMESEQIKVIDYLAKYNSRDGMLSKSLQEISKRLSKNIYPNGQLVWEEVFRESEQNWNLDKDTFGLILKTGNGFFGRNREENTSFLRKQLVELEEHKRRIIEKDAKERKMWVPVSMLSGIMLTILFL